MELTHFSIFSGIGGIDLAAEWAGFITVGQCEMADYPTKVLEKHWPDVPRWRDIKDVTAESVKERGIANITILSGGFPCQPFSVAGKQKGKKDDRYLWPEMLRVIRELKPTWVLGENVPGILRIAGRTVCEDLGRAGYAVAVFNFEAAAVGAPHRRDRIFFVGHAKHDGSSTAEIARSITEASNNHQEGQSKASESEGTGRPRSDANVAYADNWGRLVRRDGEFPAITEISEVWRDYRGGAQKHGTRKWWSVEPNVGRVANGIPSRVDRLRGLGNAVVPQQVYPIIQAIADIERGIG